MVILADGSVAVEGLVESAEEAEEMHRQMLAVEGVAQVRIAQPPGWTAV